ncbi:unnamed protein product [Gordionus sp. m RMFG-2023]|uniref:pyridoxine/pyridoxamine 5'-phosphate oxidase-like isoform X2 n=1 Tax=Gordionus sp. m RMFG-2023 TaxID=3053472 RepID=UPI0030E20848
MDIRKNRIDYNDADHALYERKCDIRFNNPIKSFNEWFGDAQKSIIEPNSMCLSTCTKDGRSSSRFVLLKGIDQETGLKFFTNYESWKGKQLAENNQASAVFYWQPLHRSVRFEGRCIKLDAAQNAEYFLERCKGSQISAIISKQSQPVKDRDTMENLCSQYEKEISASNKLLECPSYWGGYALQPDRIEFWQGQTNRLHDRFLFLKVNNEMGISREFEESDNFRELSNLTSDGQWRCQRLFP